MIDAAGGLLQTFDKRRAAQQVTRASMATRIFEFLFARRAVEQGTPVVDDRQHRSHLDELVVPA